MKLYVPEIGDKLKLTSDWWFKLHYEYRNASLINRYLPDKFAHSIREREVDFPLLAGSVLEVDRIYIRKGNSEYSSITFKLISTPSETVKGVRFWAKLKDCNNIEFEVDTTENATQNLYLVYHNYKKDQVADIHTADGKLKTCVYEGYGFTGSRAKPNKVFKILTVIQIKWSSVNTNTLQSYTKHMEEIPFIEEVEYIITDLKSSILGTYKTETSLKKNAKLIYEQQNKTK